LSEVNNFVRRRCPPLHGAAKAIASRWMNSTSPAIPAIRRIRGQRLRMHPKFLTLNLDSIEPEVMNWIQKSLNPGSVALDIGANIGIHAMYMSKLVRASGAVFAFEPSPPNLALLSYHARVNRLAQLKIIKKAVSERDYGVVPFFLLNNGDNPSNSLTFGREEVPNLLPAVHKSLRAVEVETVSVDRFCSDVNVRPDLIKIDVEGAELLVLKGCVRTLRTARPTVILAIHPWWLPPGQTVADISDFLADEGYRITDRHGAEVRNLEYGEYLCEPRQEHGI